MNKRLIIIILSLTSYLHAQQWYFDPAFGNNGQTIFNVSESNDQIKDIAVAPDGSIYGIGQLYKGTVSADFSVILLHFDSSGQWDKTFGTNGYIELPTFSAHKIEVQSDGKILIGGKDNSENSYSLLRFLPDGSPDQSFGFRGVASRFKLVSSELRSLIALPDGKIIGIGNYLNGSSANLLLVKFNPNGTLDNSFGTNGVVNNPSITGTGYAIAVQEDGRILTFGNNRNASRMQAARFNADGILDPSFGINGLMEYESGRGEKILIQSSGKILLSGTRNETSQSLRTRHAALFRIHEDGQIDETFTSSTLTTTLIENFESDYSVIQLNNGQIVQSFYKERNEKSSILLIMRYPDGTFHDSFGINGMLELDISDVFERGADLELDQQGNLILGALSDLDVVLMRFDTTGHSDTLFGGKFNLSTGDEDGVTIEMMDNDKILVSAINTAARFNNYGYGNRGIITKLDRSGYPDPAFGVAGIFRTGPKSSIYQRYCTSVTQDDGVVVSGVNYDARKVEVTKLLSNGMIDLSFGMNGYIRFNFIDSLEAPIIIPCSNVAEDGKIVIGGMTYHNYLPYNNFSIARLLPDGKFDPEFGNNGVTSIEFPDATSELYLMSLDEKGNIFIGGNQKKNSSAIKYEIVKFLNDGTLDHTFGSGGIASFGIGKSCYIMDLAIQKDGNIIAVGIVENNAGMYSVGIIRVDGITGLPDTSFGNDGWVLSTYGKSEGITRAISLQEDGKILVAGGGRNGSSVDFSIGRWLTNGELDHTFGDNGYINFNPGTSSVGCQDMILQMDSSILVAGVAVNNPDGSSDIVLARIINKLDVGTIDREDPSDVLLVYPNPVRDQIELQFELNTSGECNIALYDMNGRLVEWLAKGRSFSTGTNIVSLHPDPALPPGAYYLRIHCVSKYQAGAMIYKQ